MALLDLVHVMHKQQLRRHIARVGRVPALLVVQLDGQIPQGKRAVARARADDAVVRRVPFERGDLLFVEIERGDGFGARGRGGVFPRAQVVDAEAAVVVAGGEEVRGQFGPGEDVDVGGGDLHGERGGAGFAARVPDFHGAVGGGGGEDVALVGRPLQLFHAARVAGERVGVGDEAAAFGAGRGEDFARRVAGEKFARGD